LATTTRWNGFPDALQHGSTILLAPFGRRCRPGDGDMAPPRAGRVVFVAAARPP
jgi:hypothetical protein